MKRKKEGKPTEKQCNKKEKCKEKQCNKKEKCKEKQGNKKEKRKEKQCNIEEDVLHCNMVEEEAEIYKKRRQRRDAVQEKDLEMDAASVRMKDITTGLKQCMLIT